MPPLRTLLILGRVSNLPTVWSNCLAAWLIADGGPWWRFVVLNLGATFLYIGGMFLNDAFDEDFDRLHRRNRPIPNGEIKAATVWSLGFGMMVFGYLGVSCLGSDTALLGAFLVVAILLYNWLHKMVAASPVLMAACRFFLFLMAASATRFGINGSAIWGALVLACYIVGLSYVARRESLPGALSLWPLAFLGAPVILCLLVNDESYRPGAVVLVTGFIAWTAYPLSYLFRSSDRNIGYCVSGLLAGIALTDGLAAGWDPWTTPVFIALFGLALVFQRFVPAT
jgi:hypothetical protein